MVFDAPVIGLTGEYGSGKDTVGAYLIEHHGYQRFAFADAIRDVAYALDPIVTMTYHEYMELMDLDDLVSNDRMHAIPTHHYLVRLVDQFGWETTKNTVLSVRQLLQRIGAVHRRVHGDNIWIKTLMRKIPTVNDPIVVTDVRSVEEEQALRYVFPTSISIWRIHRDIERDPRIMTDSTEQLEGITADVVIDNSGTLDELYETVENNLHTL